MVQFLKANAVLLALVVVILYQQSKLKKGRAHVELYLCGGIDELQRYSGDQRRGLGGQRFDRFRA